MRTTLLAALAAVGVAAALTIGCGAGEAGRPVPVVVRGDSTPGPAVSAEDSGPEVEVAEEPVPARRVAPPETVRALARPAEGPAAEPEAAAPPPDSLVLPAGTRFDVVLRTPLHTAITRPGDRFAARIEEPVRSGDRIALPAGTLVEGRVARAISASESDTTALLALDFVSLTLPDGTRLPLVAGLAAPEAPTAPSDPRHPSVGGAATRGAITGAILGAVITRSRRGTAVGAAIGAAGGAIVASSRDREVIVPSGTVLPIVLRAALAVPPGSR